MTRDEAAAVIMVMVNRLDEFNSLNGLKGLEMAEEGRKAIIRQDALRMAIDALRGPAPDPDTGLMKCGCGGKAEFVEDKTEPKLGIYTVMCSKCYTRLSGYTNRIDFMKQDWNTAMGWRGEVQT